MQTLQNIIGIFPSRFVLLLGVVVFISGCCQIPQCPRLFPGQRSEVVETYSPKSYSTFASPLFQTNRPRRILLIESGPAYGRYRGNQKLIAELAAQIRATNTFEVVAPQEVRLHSVPDNILNGDFDEMEIVNISRRYNADAVAFVRINDLRAYAPIRAAITMAIVDSNETIVTFAVDGIWDTSQPGTQNEFRDYVAKSGNPGTPGSIQMQSPTQLFSFAASQIAEALAAN